MTDDGLHEQVGRPGKRRTAARPFRGPDGLTWTASARSPGATHVIVVFQHPDRTRSALDRYATWVVDSPAAHDVTARLTPADVLRDLDDAALVRLFRRAAPIASQVPRFEQG